MGKDKNSQREQMKMHSDASVVGQRSGSTWPKLGCRKAAQLEQCMSLGNRDTTYNSHSEERIKAFKIRPKNFIQTTIGNKNVNNRKHLSHMLKEINNFRKLPATTYRYF